MNKSLHPVPTAPAPTVSSNPTTTSSTTAASPGTSSSTALENHVHWNPRLGLSGEHDKVWGA